MDPLEEFWHRLDSDWLPTFCNARGYSLSAFLRTKKVVYSRDAYDFLRALSITTVNSRGEFSMPRSRAKEVIFWDGCYSTPERSFPLWIEPIITIAAIARLHYDKGWPIDCLGMQSVKSEFDLTAFMPTDYAKEYIAGEVKATSKHLDALLFGLEKCCAQREHDCSSEKPAQRNAHSKWLGLVRSKAPVFWALGPDCDSRVFSVTYERDGTTVLTRASDDLLHYPLTH